MTLITDYGEVLKADLAPAKNSPIRVELVSRNWLVSVFENDPKVYSDRLVIEGIIQRHYEQIAANKDVLKLDMSWKKYAELARRDMLACAVIRLHGRIVGYFLVLLVAMPHYDSTLIALEDAHYLDPSLRGQGWGGKMVEVIENEARLRGAQLISVRSKLHEDHGDFWRKRGYNPTEVVYTKVL